MNKDLFNAIKGINSLNIYDIENFENIELGYILIPKTMNKEDEKGYLSLTQKSDI